MIAAFQGQLELREIAVMSNEIGHQYSLHRRMEFVMLYKTLSELTTSSIKINGTSHKRIWTEETVEKSQNHVERFMIFCISAF